MDYLKLKRTTQIRLFNFQHHFCSESYGQYIVIGKNPPNPSLWRGSKRPCMKAGRQCLGLPAFCRPPHGSQKTHSTHFPTLSPNRSFFLQSRSGFVYITSLHRVVGACTHTQIRLHTADVQGDLLERQGNMELNYLCRCSTGPFTEGLTKVKSPAIPEDEAFYL